MKVTSQKKKKETKLTIDLSKTFLSTLLNSLFSLNSLVDRKFLNKVNSFFKLLDLSEYETNKEKAKFIEWIEKETLRLVTSYDKVVVEDLNLKGISAFLRNAKNMNDTSWATFVSRLEAKGKDYDCEVVKADRYYPSSQLCSKCGWQYKGLKLSEREWTCCSCGTHHIRDVNAAINLKNYIRQEVSEFTPVESSKVANLAMLALQATELTEAGSTTGDSVQKCAKSLA
jgi:transposase